MYDMAKQKDQSANAWILTTEERVSLDREWQQQAKRRNATDQNGMRVNSNKNKRTLLFEYNISFGSVFGVHITNQANGISHIYVYMFDISSQHTSELSFGKDCIVQRRRCRRRRCWCCVFAIRSEVCRFSFYLCSFSSVHAHIATLYA